MNRTGQTMLFSVFLATVFGTSSVAAQQVDKRNRCADFPDSVNALRLHENYSGAEQILSFKVVRDSCRPKLFGGAYKVVVTNGSTPIPYSVRRLGKRTISISVPVPHFWYVEVFFEPSSISTKVTGSFDYFVSVD